MNKQARNSMIYLIGAFGAALLGFINTPMLTRAMSTAEYAQYGNLTSFGTLLMSLAYLGLDEAFMRFYNERKESVGRFIIRCLFTPVLLSVVIGIVLIEPKGILSNIIFGQKQNLHILILCGVYVLLMIIQRLTMLTVRMEEHAWNYVAAELMTKLGFIAVVVLALEKKGSVTLEIIEIALICGYIIAILINAKAVLPAMTNKGTGLEHKKWYLIQYGYPFAISNTLIYFVPMVERVVMRETIGLSDLGVFTSAQIFGTVVGLFSVSLNSVWLPYVYRADVHAESFKKVFHSIGVCAVYFSIGMLAVTITCRRWLILILGEDFSQAYIIAPAVLFGACMTIVMNIYSIGINLSYKTKYHLLTPIIECLTSVSLLLLLGPRMGLAGVGIAYLVSLFGSRVAKIILGLRECDTQRSMMKVWLLLAISLFCACLSCFVYDSVLMDIISGIFLLLIGTALCYTEIRFVLHKMFQK